MSAVISATRLHLNRRRQVFLVFWRGGSQPGTTEWIQISRKPGRPIDFRDQAEGTLRGSRRRRAYFSFIKQWRGLSSRYD